MADEVSIAQARADLSAFINRVAHGRERVILTSRGRPKAALVSIQDLKALEALAPDRAARLAALAEADAVRESILRRRNGVPLPDSSEEIWAMREERMEELDPSGER